MFSFPPTLADWHGVPDAAIAWTAATLAGGLGWLVKHVTSRSAERAKEMSTAASNKDTANLTLQGRAYDTLEKIVTTLQADLGRQTERTERIEREYGERLAKLERRNGRMNTFIVRLLDCYLQIKAYVPILETMVLAVHPHWKCRTFPDVELPTFEDDAPPR